MKLLREFTKRGNNGPVLRSGTHVTIVVALLAAINANGEMPWWGVATVGVIVMGLSMWFNPSKDGR